MSKEITHNKNISYQNIEYRLSHVETDLAKKTDRIHTRITELEEGTKDAITRKDLTNWFLAGMGAMGIIVSIITTFSTLYIRNEIREENQPIKELIIEIQKDLLIIKTKEEMTSTFVQRGN